MSQERRSGKGKQPKTVGPKPSARRAKKRGADRDKSLEVKRRERQAKRLVRVLDVFELIRSGEGRNVEEIAAELGTTVRTVYRDLKVLKLAGMLEPVDEKGERFFDEENKCYRVHPWYRCFTRNPTADELHGQAIATVLTQLPGLDFGTGAKAMTRKLKSQLDEADRSRLSRAVERVSVLDLKLADHTLPKHRQTFQQALEALVQGKQLEGQYRSPYDEKVPTLRLHPYHLCLVKQAWYLLARPVDGKGLQTYRITRFESLRLLEVPAEPVPDDFDPRSFFGNAWAVYRGDEPYDVELRFTKEAADLVTETVWHSTQKVVKPRHKDGTVTLTFRVDGLDEILWWVLGWAGRVEVVRPLELRKAVSEQLRAGLKLNGG